MTELDLTREADRYRIEILNSTSCFSMIADQPYERIDDHNLELLMAPPTSATSNPHFSLRMGIKLVNRTDRLQIGKRLFKTAIRSKNTNLRLTAYLDLSLL
jgi:hypothetical protein